ncbi:MAG: TIGR03905 family TSCPD domain-containing protein [Phycisphaerae bacterium]
MREIRFATKGTCSTRIDIELNGDTVRRIRFEGGCTGNLQGIAALAAGRKVKELIPLLEGIECRNGTSCPDQLAKALKTAVRRAKPKAASPPPRG